MSTGWRGAVRRHEHALAVGWLALAGLLAVGVVLQPTRAAALTALERGVVWWDDRWQRRVDHGAALVAEGRAEEAVAFLDRLDRIHPASNTRHARDKERARLLRLLGRAYEMTGRRGRAVETYQRLVAFDSLNYYSHFVLGSAAERLESGWAVAPEARDAFAAALRIHPVHLPSLRGLVAYHMDRGEFASVRDAFRTYADAHLVQRVSIRVGSHRTSLAVLADGRTREYEVPLLGAVSPVGEVEVQADGLPFVVERVELVAAAVVGAPGVAPPVELVVGPRPSGPAGLTAPVVGRAAVEVKSVGLRLRFAVLKPVDAGLWKSVTTSLRNLLEEQRIPELEHRVAVFAAAGAADEIVGRQAWAWEGLGLGSDEQPY